MFKSTKRLFQHMQIIFQILNSREKRLLLTWFFVQSILLLLDLAALGLAGVTSSAFVPIIQSHPEDIPLVVTRFYSYFDSLFSLYEFLFSLVIISGILLLTRSITSVLADRYFYLKLSSITVRLAKLVLERHFSNPIEKRIQISNVNFLHSIHDSLNSLTIYVLGNFIIVAAEILNSTLLLGAMLIWKPLVTGLLICFITVSLLVTYKFHIQKSHKLLGNFSDQNNKSMQMYFDLNGASSDLKLRSSFDSFQFNYLKKREELSQLIATRQVQFGIPRFILEMTIVVGGLFSGLLIWYTLNISQGLVVVATLMIIGLRLQPAMLKIQNGFQVMMQHRESSSAALNLLLHYSKDYKSHQKNSIIINQKLSTNLDIRNISYKFENEKTLFKNLSFNFEEFGLYLLKGENGAGKSTIFEILVGLREPFEGTIEFCGSDLLQLSQEERGSFISYLPQNPYFYDQTIIDSLMLDGNKENFELESCFSILRKLNFDVDKYNLLSVMQLNEFLSEGEKGKLGLARTLISNSKILLLDEPTAALDLSARISLRNLLEIESSKKLVLIIAHDDSFDDIASGIWNI